MGTILSRCGPPSRLAGGCNIRLSFHGSRCRVLVKAKLVKVRKDHIGKGLEVALQSV